MVDWSDDRIAALSDQDLKNLLVNAERKSVAELIAQCKAEMEKRDAAETPQGLEAAHRAEGIRARHVRAARYGRQGDGREIRPVGRDRESQIGRRQGFQVAQAAGCQGLCQTRRHAARRFGRGRPLYFLPARQGHRVAERFPAQGSAGRSARVSCDRAHRPCWTAPGRWRKFVPPRPKRRSSPPTAGSPSRICRAPPRHSTRRWRKSRPEFQNRHCEAHAKQSIFV